MNRYEVNRHECSLSERHESKMQELRHERKAEWQRLDGLKKVLQTRLQTNPTESNEVRAT
jgi:hypothetical protein